MQWTGKKPVIFEDKLGVTGTRIAWDATTCSVNISWVNTCLIRCKLFVRIAIFMPKVWHTNSPIALIWLEWKWIAMSNNISPKLAVIPVARSKWDSSWINHWIQSTAIFSFSEFAIKELQAIKTHNPKLANLTPAAVTGGLHVMMSRRVDTSSSDNLRPAIPRRAVYNLKWRFHKVYQIIQLIWKLIEMCNFHVYHKQFNTFLIKKNTYKI